jgi:hypothetical protein
MRALETAEESEAIRDRYGRSLFGQGCLLARRLVERGMPSLEAEMSTSREVESLRVNIGAKSQRATVDDERTAHLQHVDSAKSGMTGRFRGRDNAWTLTLQTRREIPNVEAAGEFLIAQFQTALGDDFEMTIKDIRRDASLSGLFDLAEFADRNGDDRLSLEELTSYSNLVAAAVRSQVWVFVRDRGYNLLPFLDTDGDARLSYSELSRAHLVSDHERPSDLPRQYEISFGSAPLHSWGGMMIPSSRNPLNARTTTGHAGPRWFQALDRNVDGVVSPREFLGPPSAFNSFDGNGDGMVSVDEAHRGAGRNTENE